MYFRKPFIRIASALTVRANAVLAAALLILLFGLSASAKERPNVILVMADDVGYEWFSCYGSKSARTPNIDKLAGSGIRFNYAFSQPVCTPTRVQIMTGRYNHRNYQSFGFLRTSEITFGNLLKDAGYKTCITGKWQLSGDADTVRKFGFDEHCLWNMLHYDGDVKIANAPPRETLLKRFWEPCLYQNGEWKIHGKDVYGPDVVTDFMLDFITRNKQESFFCYFPMILTHSPFVPTPDSASRTNKDKRENFRDMVQYTDKIMGRIVAHLEELGLRENTLIMFTGDNGTGRGLTGDVGTHKVAGGKGSLTHPGTHVPFVANWPAVNRNSIVSDDLIDFSDVLPTIVDACGVELPSDRKIDGRSFLPQIRGEKGNPREWVFCHYFGGKGRTKKGAASAIWDRRWKLYEDGRFYDLADTTDEESVVKPDADEAKAAHAKLSAAINAVLKD
jgi:arylsulfatase A